MAAPIAIKAPQSFTSRPARNSWAGRTELVRNSNELAAFSISLAYGNLERFVIERQRQQGASANSSPFGVGVALEEGER